MNISEFAKVVLFKISRSKRRADLIGSFMSVDELEHIFGEDQREQIDEALTELKNANYIKEVEDNEDIYTLTQFGEVYLTQPKASNASSTSKAEYTLSPMEEEVLRFFYEKHHKKHRRRDTPTGLVQDVARNHKDWDRSEIEDAVRILTDQKYFNSVTESHRFDPKVFNQQSKDRPYTVKTTYIELTGKALLYLKDRTGGNKTTAGVYDKSTPYTTRRQLEGVFEAAKNQISVADNYVGRKTLDYLLTAQVPIRILTSTNKEKNFDAALADFSSEYAQSIQIERVDGILHGRFIIADDKYYLIDHSVKDFGSKPSAIIEITDSVVQAAYKKLFEDNWPS